MTVTVCIATIPTRPKQLKQALLSVIIQTLTPDAIVVEYDHHHTGAAATKNRALAKVSTDFVAFLDDDDQFMPSHLASLMRAQIINKASVVYSRPFIPQIVNHEDPSGRHGLPFSADELRKRSYIQTTSLIRTDLFQEVGGFQCPPHSDYDDWGGYLALLNADAKFYHLNEQTFIWNHWGAGTPDRPGNTSGRGDRW